MTKSTAWLYLGFTFLFLPFAWAGMLGASFLTVVTLVCAVVHAAERVEGLQ